MKSKNVEQNTGSNRKEEKKDLKFLMIPYILLYYHIHKGVTSLGFKFVFHQKFFFLIASTSPVLFAGSK